MFFRKQREIDELRAKINKLENELVELEFDLDARKGEINDLTKQLVDAENDLNDATNELDRVNLAHDQLQEKLDDALRKIKNRDEFIDIIRDAKAEADNRTSECKERIKKLDEQVEEDEKIIDSVLATNKSLVGTLQENSACIAALAEGVYNQEHIEFFALKTYRGGWKYICCGGKKITDFDGISCINISWDQGEKIRLTIDN